MGRCPKPRRGTQALPGPHMTVSGHATGEMPGPRARKPQASLARRRMRHAERTEDAGQMGQDMGLMAGQRN